MTEGVLSDWAEYFERAWAMRVDEPNAQVSLFALRILRDRHHQA
jgi:hypothetical protein